jgi:hypothetical protein
MKHLKSMLNWQIGEFWKVRDKFSLASCVSVFDLQKHGSENEMNPPAINNLSAKICMPLSGIVFDYLNPTMDMIDINDIAHHLSQICRYSGGMPHIYSVARHSIICSRASQLKYGSFSIA